MEVKLKYLNLIKRANGQIDEIELGEKCGLNEDETRVLISLLLSEHRIAYQNFTYRTIKRSRKRNRR